MRSYSAIYQLIFYHDRLLYQPLSTKITPVDCN